MKPVDDPKAINNSKIAIRDRQDQPKPTGRSLSAGLVTLKEN